MKKAPTGLPIPVRRALQALGADIATARKRRGLTLAAMAERVFATRQTIARVERGDAGVAMGTYATVLFALGLTDRVLKLAAPDADQVGKDLEREKLPERVRSKR
jgi:transcriptional regulator with XRE-family HTH domain